jgi:hypothetical protein
MGSTADLAATAHAFNKILSQPKLSSKTRTPEDVEESVKKLRRLILIEGIPSKAVRTPLGLPWFSHVCIDLMQSRVSILFSLVLFVGSYTAIQDLENPAQGQ